MSEDREKKLRELAKSGDPERVDAAENAGFGGDGGDMPDATAPRSAVRKPLARRETPVWWSGWWLPVFALVLGVTCVLLVPLTSFWWLVLVLAAAVPVAVAALDRPRRRDRERELLSALAEGGELTPAAASMRTSLTVDEAAKMLEELTRKGHVWPRAEDGIVTYALHERRRGFAGATPLGAGQEPEGGEAPRPLDEPLSERESEVLALLNSGRTNREIAGDLFVTVGTIKAHTSNIYRKLGAKNRAEALSKARAAGLLH